VGLCAAKLGRGRRRHGGGAGPALRLCLAQGQARKLAGAAYQASQDTLPPAMAKLGYDQYQSLRFRTDHALWANAGLAFRLQFFHVGRSFTEPVRLYEILDGQSREIVYDPRCSNSTRPASIRT